MKLSLLFLSGLFSFTLCFSKTLPVKDSLVLLPGKPVEREIRGSEVHHYTVTLHTGEFVRGTVEQSGIAIRVRGFFPDGLKIRAFTGPQTGTKTFRFVAELPGTYVLELKAQDSSLTGSYKIMIKDIQPMDERLKITDEERYRSPRLAALQKEIAAGTKGVEDVFWDEVAKSGTPLAEPTKNNPKYQLVTFLWKETFPINNVVVIWTPYSLEHPEDYKMIHLTGSKVWYKTLRIPAGARFLYQLSPNETLSRSENAQRYATVQADPLNPRRKPNDPNLTKYETFSIAELPGAPEQPWAVSRPEIPAGKIDKYRFKSDIMGNERDIAVYTPANYNATTNAYPLLILFDGTTYLSSVPAPVTLDNLIAAKKIAPVVTVLIDAASQNVRGDEFTCNPKFAELMAKELLPWIRKRYHVTLNPANVTVGGLSNGGLAAVYTAMRNPEIYGNVLVQSGMFWWSPGRDNGEEPNWIARQFIDQPKLPLRFYIDAGKFENDIFGSGGQILETSRQLRDILKAKGYQVYYQEFIGGHDQLSWRGTLADGLIALIPLYK
ncbi:MAG: putative esterase [Chitinophagaceae bacterium]|nr:putative esterase [Chitinophagaceae bacterium]